MSKHMSHAIEQSPVDRRFFVVQVSHSYKVGIQRDVHKNVMRFLIEVTVQYLGFHLVYNGLVEKIFKTYCSLKTSILKYNVFQFQSTEGIA